MNKYLIAFFGQICMMLCNMWFVPLLCLCCFIVVMLSIQWKHQIPAGCGSYFRCWGNSVWRAVLPPFTRTLLNCSQHLPGVQPWDFVPLAEGSAASWPQYWQLWLALVSLLKLKSLLWKLFRFEYHSTIYFWKWRDNQLLISVVFSSSFKIDVMDITISNKVFSFVVFVFQFFQLLKLIERR